MGLISVRGTMENWRSYFRFEAISEIRPPSDLLAEPDILVGFRRRLGGRLAVILE